MHSGQAVFDENLIAVQAGTVQIFNFDIKTHEYLSTENEYIPEGVGIPASSCLEAPPVYDNHQTAVRTDDNSAWETVDDYRGVVVYDILTLTSRVISELGPLPDTVTTSQPITSFDKWDGSVWVTDVDAQHADDVAIADKQKSELLATTSVEISILQDAVNLEMATDAEKSRLLSLQTYRVLLNRVNTALAPDIEWPTVTMPSAETETDNG
ncbi:tail fiber assembly protein [Phytobacter sp. V91]|uniref:tail fiber assembly protein n=1 Tax=Phytobacter sp. V91 TaxID=3369425 RepID=UPI003F61ADA5